MDAVKANDGKTLVIEVNGKTYERIPVRTHVITDTDKLADVLTKYVKPVLQDGDIVFMSEKAVACTQKRAVRMKDIKPRLLARILCKFVLKTPYGIGLGIPETMEMALRECGTWRILYAAFVSMIGKLIGKRGWFYMVAGDKARAIDGPCDYTLPPYNEYVVLGPLEPDKTAEDAAKAAGVPDFCIVDANDLGCNVLGISRSDMNRDRIAAIIKDNPLGQSDEQTPIGIIREIKEPVKNMVREWLLSERENIVRDLSRIIAIPSVSQPGDAVAPFGQNCRDVLDEMLGLCEENGFATENYDYYGGSASLAAAGESGKTIGFWSHLDVVPAVGEWKSPPFEAQVRDGFLIGRGARDNKNAAVAGLYIMKYLRGLETPLKSNVRVFFGCAEEVGMRDMEHLAAHCDMPDFSIVADADFPVCYGEKGALTMDLVSPPLSDTIKGFSAGVASNIVADAAVVRLAKTQDVFDGLVGVDGVKILNDAVEIASSGQAAHAAQPEGSVNAIGVLSALLAERGLVPADQDAFLFLAAVCGDHTGAPLNIAASHEEFGTLTCVGGMADFLDGRISLNLNIRYPYSEKSDEIVAKIKAVCDAARFAVQNISNAKPSLVDRNSDFVQTLSAEFSRAAGKEYPAYIMGGGTYARLLPNAVAFGPAFPEEIAAAPPFLPGHGNEHQPDEALCVDEYLRAIEIYINTILALDAKL